MLWLLFFFRLLPSCNYSDLVSGLLPVFLQDGKKNWLVSLDRHDNITKILNKQLWFDFHEQFYANEKESGLLKPLKFRISNINKLGNVRFNSWLPQTFIFKIH